MFSSDVVRLLNISEGDMQLLRVCLGLKFKKIQF